MAIALKPLADDPECLGRSCGDEVTAVERLEAQRLNLEGMRLGQSGKLAAAVAVLQRAAYLDPSLWPAHNNLGIALARLRAFDQAALCFRRAVSLAPATAQAHCNLASVLAEGGRHDEAIASFHSALRLDPHYFDARFNLGKAFFGAGRFDEAVESFRHVLRVDPGMAKAHRHLGLALAMQAKCDEALASLRQAVELDPDDAENHLQLGCVLREARRYREAMACLERTLRLRPDCCDALNALGICLTQEGQHERAVDCFQRAIQLRGESSGVRCNWGIALAAWGRYEEAIEQYRQALEARPDFVEAYNNIGGALLGLRRFDEAIANYSRAIELRHDYADGRRNRALLFLLRGDLSKGWEEFEWRWRCRDFEQRHFSQPAWDGGPLQGKTILLHAEQGLGDTLQFIRYASLVKARGATVVVRAPRQLVPLLSHSADIDRLVTGNDFNEFDVHAPLMSLAKLFGTTLETIPSSVPYLFVDDGLVEQWRRELAPLRQPTPAGKTPPLLVGINWQGNPRYLGDRQRSIRLKFFAPLAGLPQVRLVNLQKGYGAEQLLEVAHRFVVSEPVPDVDRARGRFMDTAAIMKNLDLVVTSDTAVAHLAGGLGVPVWLALPYVPDWRWLLDRDDSPWYPTMRLFRQTAPDDWEGVFRRIRRELRSLAALRRPSPVAAREGRTATNGRDHPPPGIKGLQSLIAYAVHLATSGKLREALVAFKRALWLHPDAVDAHYNQGVVLQRLGRANLAVASFRRCLRLSPRHVEARTSLGVALADVGLPQRAEKELRHSLRLTPKNAETHYSLGNVLASQGRWQEALDRFQHAAKLRPDFAQPHYGVANVYRQQGKFDAALAAYDRALELQPNFKEARRLRAATHLLLGDFERGWSGLGSSSQPALARPARWLLHAGRELGETLVLLRYAELARQKGVSVWVDCPEEQRAIVGGCRGVDLALAGRCDAPAVDAHAPLAALPFMVGAPPPEAAARAPFLQVDPSLVERWRKELDLLGGVKVGVHWDSPDRDGAFPEKWIQSVAQIPELRVLNFGAMGPLVLGTFGGKHVGQDQRLAAEALKSEGLATTMNGVLVPYVETFADLAALIANLDLVIATEGPCAHLAGALDIPLYVPLPVVPEWCWFLGRRDSPWYPSARLFRQSRRGEWSDVCERISRAIADLLRSDRGSDSPAWDQADRLCGEGVALLERGRADDALAQFKSAVEIAPTYATAYNNLGSAFARLGRHEDAASAYRTALKRRPNYPEALVNLGTALTNLGQHEEAVRNFRRAVRQRPEWARGHFYLGNALVTLGQWHAALASYREGRRLAPQDEDLQLNLGVALREAGRLEEAAATLEELLRAHPDHVDALNNLAVTWCRLRQHWKALECLQYAVRLRPEFAAAHNNLGITLAHLERYGDAVAAYQRALAISPDYAEAYNNLGIALTMEGRFRESLASFERALELRPGYPQACNNQGIALKELGQADEALAGYERALAADPDYADAHLNRAFALLSRGDWPRGWQEYEWRFKQRPSAQKRFAQPVWEGEPLDGRTLLICCEQGLGDILQFIRFAGLAEQRGARLIIRCPKRMINLLSRAGHIELLVGEDDELPAFDCHVPLLSLPRILGITLETLPDQVPYLSADPGLVEHWASRLRDTCVAAVPGPSAAEHARRKLLVGVNWQGNSHYQGDRQRSFSIGCFAPLADIPGVRLLSLQKGVGQEQMARLHVRQPFGDRNSGVAPTGFTIADLGPDVDESRGAFMDTAAVMMHLDLVITSDTSVAHLAGALGRPVWVALPFSADWRWLLRRDDSPWYPTMRLYRQPARGDWEAVFQRIKDDLTELVTAQIGNDLAE